MQKSRSFNDGHKACWLTLTITPQTLPLDDDDRKIQAICNEIDYMYTEVSRSTTATSHLKTRYNSLTSEIQKASLNATETSKELKNVEQLHKIEEQKKKELEEKILITKKKLDLLDSCFIEEADEEVIELPNFNNETESNLAIQGASNSYKEFAKFE